MLTALIACQSVLAFADSHEMEIAFPVVASDQADIVQSELTVNQLNERDATPLGSIDGCDHCGFCHHGQSIPALQAFSSAPRATSLNTQYNSAVPSGPLFSFYRPPKV